MKPKNLEQKLAFDLLQNNDIKIKLLFGAVGSGKTMLLVKYALQQICEGNFKKIMRIRNNEEPSDSNNI
ncbi:MAG: PhoH family protein [Candidatus Peribacteria bacterium]|nr:PhoH family protein [Candidatus Peribacteria bacterium]